MQCMLQNNLLYPLQFPPVCDVSGLSDPYNDNGKPKSNLISWSWWGSILTHKLMKCLGKIAEIQENNSNSLIGIQDTCCSSIFTLEQFVFELGQNSLNWYKIV